MLNKRSISPDICFKKAYNTKKKFKMSSPETSAPSMAFWQLASPPIKIEKQISTKEIIVITYILL